TELEERVERALQQRPRRMQRQLLAFLRVIELLAIVRYGRGHGGAGAGAAGAVRTPGAGRGAGAASMASPGSASPTRRSFPMHSRSIATSRSCHWPIGSLKASCVA